MCELERFESDVAPPTNKPHSTSARASGITSDALPPELIEHVASYLGSKNTCSLRLTPSCLSKSSFYYFRSAFIFQGRTASHEASLRELECLAHNDNLARYIMSMAIRRTSHGRLGLGLGWRRDRPGVPTLEQKGRNLRNILQTASAQLASSPAQQMPQVRLSPRAKKSSGLFRN